MTVTVKKPATYQDLCALPETVVGELVAGGARRLAPARQLAIRS